MNSIILMVLMTFFSFPLFAVQMDLNLKNAEKLREEGKTLDAIDMYNRLIVQFQEEEDYHQVLNALMSELICWQHQYNRSKDKVFAIFTKKIAEAIIEIAEDHKIFDQEYKLHFFLAKSYTLLKNYAAAEKEFRLSVELFPVDNAEKGDFIAHWGYVTYLNGDKEKGKKLLLEGMKKIENFSEGVDSFLINVWISGIYLRLANLLHIDNHEEGRYYLDKAQQIISKDPRLTIRKETTDKNRKRL